MESEEFLRHPIRERRKRRSQKDCLRQPRGEEAGEIYPVEKIDDGEKGWVQRRAERGGNAEAWIILPSGRQVEVHERGELV